MLNRLRLPLLAACVLALPVTAADDAALAARLVGTWEGRWEFGEAGGRLTVVVTAASGDSLKGRSKWWATVVGDFEDAFTKSKLKEGKLKVSESTMDFEVTVSADGTRMEGTWTSPMASGPMKLALQPEKPKEPAKEPAK